MSHCRLSIDLGETFTDFVLMDETGQLHIKKIPSSFHDSDGNLAQDITRFLSESGESPSGIDALIVGVSVQVPPQKVLEGVRRLEQLLHADGWTAPLQLVSIDGRLLSLKQAEEDPTQIMAPRIGGILTARYFGAQIGQKSLILLRMGGSTSFVSLFNELSTDSNPADLLATAGRSLPIGGNSYIGLEADGSLSILSEHALPGPGPACFDRGGTRPTLTDVDLLLGYLNKDYFLYGAIPLNLEAARQAVKQHIADPLAISVEEAAMRVCRGVEKRLASIIRKLTDHYSPELSAYSILAFGGAGPVHACEIAKLLDVHQVVVPVGAGVVSAVGYLFIKPENDPEWTLPPLLKRVAYYTPNRRTGDFHALKGYRAVYYERDLTPCSCPIYDRANIRAEDRLSGPGIIEGPETTVVIREKSYVEMDTFRNLRIHMR